MDGGLVMLAGFITYHYVGANMSVSIDDRSRLRSRSLHGSQRLLRCLRRNVSFEGHEREVILRCTHGGKQLEVLNRFNASVRESNSTLEYGRDKQGHCFVMREKWLIDRRACQILARLSCLKYICGPNGLLSDHPEG